MSTPTDILREQLARVRRELYRGKPDQVWFAQQQMVKKALTYPAQWLHERRIPFTDQRYCEMLDLILTTIVRRGNLGQVAFTSRYLPHAAQEHMRHHDDAYYLEGKKVSSHLAVAMRKLERPRPQISAVTILAQVHASILLGKRKPKKMVSPSSLQPDLFATAKPLHRSRERSIRAKLRARLPVFALFSLKTPFIIRVCEIGL